MIEAGLPPARRDREIDPGIIEHPFCVIRLHYDGLRGKKRRVKSDRVSDVRDCDVNMHAFHLANS
jgi:hypothetical protein